MIGPTVNFSMGVNCAATGGFLRKNTCCHAVFVIQKLSKSFKNPAVHTHSVVEKISFWKYMYHNEQR